MQSTNAGAASTDRYTSPVEITADDIAWFRSCRSAWIESENGAPAVVAARMSIEEFPEVFYSPRLRDVLERLERTLCAFFVHSRFVSGHYALEPPVLASEAFAGAPELAAFDVSPDHVRIFRQTNWRVSTIDTKRPYGHSGYYEADIARILNMPLPPREEYSLPR